MKAVTMKTNRPTIIRTHDPKADTLTCENVGVTSLPGETPQRYVTLKFTGVSLITDQAKWDCVGADLTIKAVNGGVRKAGDKYLAEHQKTNEPIRIPALSPGAKITTPETRRIAVDKAVANCTTVREAEATYLAFKQRHEQLLANEKAGK